MMRRLFFIVFIVIVFIGALFAAPAAQAQEGQRFALLIGNSNYTQKVGPLKNPRNDVALVGEALRNLGFTVTILQDADYRTMDTALKRYVADVRRAGKGAISFFYYSGHGVANPETQINYLIPVDLADPSDNAIWYQSFQQNDIIEKLSKQAPDATHYVVFDACRNELNLSAAATKALGAEKGFVPIQQTSGLLLAYSTAPNKTASDVGDGAGPYARVLAEELVKPGVEAVTMFRNVQIRVKETIGQDPWLSFPSLPSVYFAGRVDPARAAKDEAEKAEAAKTEATKAAAQAEIAKAEAARALAQADIAKSEAAKLEALKQEASRTQAANAAAEAARAEEAKADAAKAAAQADIAKAEAARKQAEAEIAKSEATKAEANKAAAQLEAVKAEKAANAERAEQVASLPSAPPAQKSIDAADIARLLQFHLKRVGCDPGTTDGSWTDRSQHAMEAFNKYSGSHLDVTVASLDALDAVRGATARVCPLVCAPGSRLEGDHCARISCEAGSTLGSDGACHREAPKPVEHRPTQPAASAAPRGSGKCFSFNGKQFCE
jgi:uncharacterized caspase-like protein